MQLNFRCPTEHFSGYQCDDEAFLKTAEEKLSKTDYATRVEWFQAPA